MAFFGAFVAAWDDAMVARWSANPLGMLWPEVDATFVTSGGVEVGADAAAHRQIDDYFRHRWVEQISEHAGTMPLSEHDAEWR